MKWISSDSLLVIDKKGELRRIYCPFKVISMADFPELPKGQKAIVDAVKLTVEIKKVFIISDTAYHIAYFRISLEQ